MATPLKHPVVRDAGRVQGMDLMAALVTAAKPLLVMWGKRKRFQFILSLSDAMLFAATLAGNSKRSAMAQAKQAGEKFDERAWERARRVKIERRTRKAKEAAC